MATARGSPPTGKLVAAGPKISAASVDEKTTRTVVSANVRDIEARRSGRRNIGPSSLPIRI
jgi:hypothetical protein